MTSAVSNGSQQSANTITIQISILVGLRRVAFILLIISSGWWPGALLFHSLAPVKVYSVAMATKGKM